MHALALCLTAALAMDSLPPDAPVAAATSRPRLVYSGGSIPTGYELVEEYNATLTFGGASAYLLGYSASVVFGLAAGIQAMVQMQRGDPFFGLVPLVGPFLARGGTTYRSQLSANSLFFRDVLLLVSGVVQVAGVAMGSVGYFFPTKVLRMKEEPAPAPPP